MLIRTLCAAAALAAMLGPAVAAASAQESRPINARVIFKAEAREFRTSACLQLYERVYPATRWWEGAAGPASGPDRAFRDVIAAIQQKNRAALLKRTDPSQTRDVARFDEQAGMFFSQFQSIRLVEVARAYELDDMVVYFGRFQSDTQEAFVPLTFAYQGEDSFGFLPERSDKVTAHLLNDWFNSRTGDLASTAAYCTDAEIKRATHRVALTGGSFRPSTLLLTGGVVGALAGAAGPVSAVASQVVARVQQMRAALKAGDMDTFYQSMTPEGAGRLRQWLLTATPAEREGYIATFLQQEPLFLFDESPLAILYIRTGSGAGGAAAASGAQPPPGLATPAPGIQTLYFTPGPAGTLVWTNSSHVTYADRVFREGRLAAAAAQTPPFSSLVIK